MNKYNRALYDNKKGAGQPIPEQIVILDDFDFSFTQKEINLAAYLYNHGATMRDIAKRVRPNLPEDIGMVEATLLIMHLSWKNKVNPGNMAKDFWE